MRFQTQNAHSFDFPNINCTFDAQEFYSVIADIDVGIGPLYMPLNVADFLGGGGQVRA